ncbi:uncharacterized protein LOC127838383 isoform X2 [Dreissena polymorpha]|uniref:uncharacterized protein LOC127838383 isoform X2 n=1 Tax=Dreissena polymorpha TaxID=45954 RepID=UPI00226443B9|nr:uncharacterized protein LOC127838383 isoform X2 [Dreissena polymorpha]
MCCCTSSSIHDNHEKNSSTEWTDNSMKASPLKKHKHKFQEDKKKHRDRIRPSSRHRSKQKAEKESAVDKHIKVAHGVTRHWLSEESSPGGIMVQPRLTQKVGLLSTGKKSIPAKRVLIPSHISQQTDENIRKLVEDVNSEFQQSIDVTISGSSGTASLIGTPSSEDVAQTRLSQRRMEKLNPDPARKQNECPMTLQLRSTVEELVSSLKTLGKQVYPGQDYLLETREYVEKLFLQNYYSQQTGSQLALFKRRRDGTLFPNNKGNRANILALKVGVTETSHRDRNAITFANDSITNSFDRGRCERNLDMEILQTNLPSGICRPGDIIHSVDDKGDSAAACGRFRRESLMVNHGTCSIEHINCRGESLVTPVAHVLKHSEQSESSHLDWFSNVGSNNKMERFTEEGARPKPVTAQTYEHCSLKVPIKCNEEIRYAVGQGEEASRSCKENGMGLIKGSYERARMMRAIVEKKQVRNACKVKETDFMKGNCEMTRITNSVLENKQAGNSFLGGGVELTYGSYETTGIRNAHVEKGQALSSCTRDGLNIIQGNNGMDVAMNAVVDTSQAVSSRLGDDVDIRHGNNDMGVVRNAVVEMGQAVSGCTGKGVELKKENYKMTARMYPVTDKEKAGSSCKSDGVQLLKQNDYVRAINQQVNLPHTSLNHKRYTNDVRYASNPLRMSGNEHKNQPSQKFSNPDNTLMPSFHDSYFTVHRSADNLYLHNLFNTNMKHASQEEDMDLLDFVDSECQTDADEQAKLSLLPERLSQSDSAVLCKVLPSQNVLNKQQACTLSPVRVEISRLYIGYTRGKQ